MRFRIKQEGDLEYARYYPQRKGWKTGWMWENFHVPTYEIPTYVKHNPNAWYSEEYDSLFYKTYAEAEQYIEKYKVKHFKKKHEIPN